MKSDTARGISKSVALGLAAFAMIAVSSQSWALGSRGDKNAARAAQTVDHGDTGAPEIDAGSAATAVALLAGGLALLRHRARR
jgi:hypothetical protein